MSAAAAAPSAGALPPQEEFCALAPEEMVRLVRARPRSQLPPSARLRCLLHLSRPRTWPASVLTFALGVQIAGGGLPERVLLGGLASVLVVFAANVVNVFSDLEEDARNLPGRVYMVAQLGYGSLAGVVVATSTLLLLIGLSVGGGFFVTTLIAALGVVQYSLPPVRAKERPLLGLFVFAQALGFPLLLGWYAVRDDAAGLEPKLLGAWLFLTILWLAKGMFKNVPDFYGDSVAGVVTSATYLGTWRRAATAAGLATLAAYAALVPLVLSGLLDARVLFALAWLPLSMWNCKRLIDADDGARGNDILQLDMIISCCLLATFVALVAPSLGTVLAIVVSVALFAVGDLLKLDSRRSEDTGRGRRW